METTVLRVKSLGEHINEMSDSQIQMYIEDAILELEMVNVPPKYEEKTQRYLAAHYATIQTRRAKSEDIDDIKVQYDSVKGVDLNMTMYGREARRIIDNCTGPNFYIRS